MHTCRGNDPMKLTLLWIASCLLFAAPLNAVEEFPVVTTTPDLAAIARAVIGEAASVYAISRPDQDPHYVQAKPSHMAKLRRARAVVYTGLQLEIGWISKLLEGSRNPTVMPGRPGNLDASKAIERILEVPTGEVDRSMGDIHPEGNPHYLLDPRNGILAAGWMALEFGALDPQNADRYLANAEAFEADIKGAITKWEMRAAPLRGLKVIAHHKQWEYLVDWLGLDLVGYVEDRPGISPSPRHIHDLERLIRSDRIETIIKAHYVPSRAPEILADRTGARALTLPATVTGKDGIDTYRDLFDTIIERLVTASE